MRSALQARMRLRQNGAVAIEYGILLPVLLMFVLGIMDTGRLLWTYTTLSRAAETAARCGAVNTTLCATAADIQNHAVAEAWGLTIAPSAFTVTTPSCGIQVTASYAFTFVVPWFEIFTLATVPGTITMTATACYPA